MHSRLLLFPLLIGGWFSITARIHMGPLCTSLLYPTGLLSTYTGTGVQNPQPSVLQGDWQLEFLLSAVKDSSSLFPRQRPAIRFDTATMSSSGNTGCNRFSGSYVAVNGQLRFDMEKMALTRMACTGEGEGIFLDAMKKTNRFAFEGSSLVLLKDDIVLMRLKKK
ncbi:META domain-containing protein [Flavihumibacter profundi]|uniref:META domain-containing protein n=1 Tax=Flavihumibacter profundi TaxID=2716883 RepID=UPI001CC73FC0|nr:META domain-containing protein [Flavihumibacter profundi]MBZ5857860.1 META domain-containing protein [Flavihumibacter profundi]